MRNLERYVEKVKKYIEENPGLSENEIVRYVYIDLGTRLAFNTNFIPFGNSKKRQQIYLHSQSEKDLEECMETSIVICKSAARIADYVLSSLGVDISTKVPPDDDRKCPHVYNVVKPKEGESYIIDLQEDMFNIQSHAVLKNFGLSVEDEKSLVISRIEQQRMDRKIGYIDDGNYYSDEYVDLLKLDIEYFDEFEEKVQFVLENIDAYASPNMKYMERQWYHAYILGELFSNDEFDFIGNNKKIRIVNCSKEVNGEKRYLNCVSVQTRNGTDIYVYNKNQSKYCKTTLERFARAVQNGLVIHSCSVPGLNKALRDLRGSNGEEERGQSA